MIDNFEQQIEFTISQIIAKEKRRKQMYINKAMSKKAVNICIAINLIIFAMGVFLEADPHIVELITLRLQPLINCIFLLAIKEYTV